MSVLMAMWPMMAVMTLTPRPHRTSFTRTGVAYFRKLRTMSQPGRSSSRKFSGTRR